MKVTAGGSDQEYESCPEGSHAAICYGVVDLGTQTGKFGEKHELRIYWEVCCDERMSDGRRFGVNEKYSLSLHKKSNLRRDLEAWRGKPFEDMESFEMKNIIGVPCLVNIVHTHKEDSTYADVKSIMSLPKAMEKPTMENDPLFVSLQADEFEPAAFDKLSDRMKETIQRSPEYQAMYGQPVRTAADGIQPDDENSIPF